MKQFHGGSKHHSFFEGWYLKHQTPDFTICLIPAFHVTPQGISSVSIQVITQDISCSVSFGSEQFLVNQERFSIQIEKNHFSSTGISVDLELDDFYVRGSLSYGLLTPLSTDIMGPFSHIPFLQCNHGVLSMCHTLSGILDIHGRKIDFSGGTGYIEKDWGSSFPQSYLWTQGSFLSPGGLPCCVMVSVAHIPFLGGHFTGCISAVWYEGREYRLATYHRAKITEYTRTGVTLEQGQLRLQTRLLSGGDFRPLYAPADGAMDRIIHENVSSAVEYRFCIGGKVLFDITVPNAGFESGGSLGADGRL